MILCSYQAVNVWAREANQQFSALMKSVESDGDTIVITRRGHPVVRMERATERRDPAEVTREINAIIDKYARPGGGAKPDRASLYTRGMDFPRR